MGRVLYSTQLAPAQKNIVERPKKKIHFGFPDKNKPKESMGFKSPLQEGRVYMVQPRLSMSSNLCYGHGLF